MSGVVTSDFTLGVVNVWGGECLGGERLTITRYGPTPQTCAYIPFSSFLSSICHYVIKRRM